MRREWKVRVYESPYYESPYGWRGPVLYEDGTCTWDSKEPIPVGKDKIRWKLIGAPVDIEGLRFISDDVKGTEDEWNGWLSMPDYRGPASGDVV